MWCALWSATGNAGEAVGGGPMPAADSADFELPEIAGEFRPWKYVVLHHSATESGSVESIDAVHRQRRNSDGVPWLGIGYHFVIGNGHGLPDGEVRATFRWREQREGAHAGVSLYNEYGLGICLIGNFDASPPTAAQLDTLKKLLSALQRQFAFSPEQILTHANLKATACPGKLLSLEAINSIRHAVEQQRPAPPPRFTPVTPGITEEVNHAVSIQRAANYRRPAPRPVPAQ